MMVGHRFGVSFSLGNWAWVSWWLQRLCRRRGGGGFDDYVGLLEKNRLFLTFLKIITNDFLN